MKWHHEHLPEPLPAEPLALAASWLAEATARGTQPNPNAMVLATTNAAGQPSARVVLCKQIEPDPGYLSFYTNYHSRKGYELESNPRAAIVMHWDALRRQLRVEGRAVQVSALESDAYFAPRNWRSRLGAWASQQSEPIASRGALLRNVAKVELRFPCQRRPAMKTFRIPASASRGRRTGAATSCGPKRSSCGWRAARASTIGRAGAVP
jgi:pyridoxamine 5'-phosphate oxidase